MSKGYLDDLRAHLQTALNYAPHTYWSHAKERGVWIPLQDHLRMPHDVQEHYPHGRDLDLRKLSYPGTCMNWRAAQISSYVSGYMPAPSSRCRMRCTEDAFFFALSPDGGVLAPFRLMGTYITRDRPTAKNPDAYTAELQADFSAALTELSPKQFDQLIRPHAKVVKVIELFVKQELLEIREHIELGLRTLDQASQYIESQALERA